MVNNSTNINKMNNHVLSQIIEHKKRSRDMILGIQGLALDRHENMTGLNRLLLSKPFHLDNWIFNGYTDMNKQLKKNLHIFVSFSFTPAIRWSRFKFI
jgi:hypothetical protein